MLLLGFACLSSLRLPFVDFFHHQSLNALAPHGSHYGSFSRSAWSSLATSWLQLPLWKQCLPNIQFPRQRPKYSAACWTSSLACTTAPHMNMNIFFPKFILVPCLCKWPHIYPTPHVRNLGVTLDSSFTLNTPWLKSYCFPSLQTLPLITILSLPWLKCSCSITAVNCKDLLTGLPHLRFYIPFPTHSNPLSVGLPK